MLRLRWLVTKLLALSVVVFCCLPAVPAPRGYVPPCGGGAYAPNVNITVTQGGYWAPNAPSYSPPPMYVPPMYTPPQQSTQGHPTRPTSPAHPATQVHQPVPNHPNATIYHPTPTYQQTTVYHPPVTHSTTTVRPVTTTKETVTQHPVTKTRETVTQHTYPTRQETTHHNLTTNLQKTTETRLVTEKTSRTEMVHGGTVGIHGGGGAVGIHGGGGGVGIHGGGAGGHVLGKPLTTHTLVTTELRRFEQQQKVKLHTDLTKQVNVTHGQRTVTERRLTTETEMETRRQTQTHTHLVQETTLHKTTPPPTTVVRKTMTPGTTTPGKETLTHPIALFKETPTKPKTDPTPTDPKKTKTPNAGGDAPPGPAPPGYHWVKTLTVTVHIDYSCGKCHNGSLPKAPLSTVSQGSCNRPAPLPSQNNALTMTRTQPNRLSPLFLEGPTQPFVTPPPISRGQVMQPVVPVKFNPVQPWPVDKVSPQNTPTRPVQASFWEDDTPSQLPSSLQPDASTSPGSTPPASPLVPVSPTPTTTSQPQPLFTTNGGIKSGTEGTEESQQVTLDAVFQAPVLPPVVGMQSPPTSDLVPTAPSVAAVVLEAPVLPAVPGAWSVLNPK